MKQKIKTVLSGILHYFTSRRKPRNRSRGKSAMSVPILESYPTDSEYQLETYRKFHVPR